MATETPIVTEARSVPLWSSQTDGQRSDVVYPDAKWSETVVNYFKDYDLPPPDTLNSTLSEHEMRMVRRSDESPHVLPTRVSIRNIRGHESDYSIEEHGFAIKQMKLIDCDWKNDDSLKRVYFPEITKIGRAHV